MNNKITEPPFIEITDFWVKPFEITAIEGYKPSVNKETGEKLPDCCSFHKGTYANLKDWFSKFPDCCEGHKALKDKWWFNKNHFDGVPEKVINQLSYTEFHIENRIHNEDWYKDITDYLEYNHFSFGTPAIGFGHYVESLKRELQSSEWLRLNKIPIGRAKQIVQYLDGLGKPTQGQPVSFALLYSTYQKWLKIFPFNISYFKNAKQHFEKKFPIVEGKPEHNQYTGMTKMQTVTHRRLIEILTDYTKQLLQTVAPADLLKDGLIADVQKHRIDLLNESHRIKQSSLLEKFTEGEMVYIRVLKTWLSNEREYFREFATITGDTQKADNSSSVSIDEIARQENKFWKGMPMNVVVEHFKVFTERKSKNGKPFLTMEQLTLFLKKGFLGDNSVPVQKLNLSNGEKGFVIKRFYEFFDLAVSQYNDLNKKFKYIKLITTCFDNWDVKTIEPFFKPNKAKEDW
jgi:hypothetical protein